MSKMKMMALANVYSCKISRKLTRGGFTDNFLIKHKDEN